MNCPSCQEALSGASRRCRNCGARIACMESGVMKTSAVLVAAGGSRSFYTSLREVPEPLRQQVIESTCGRNSGTILIADRRGKEELERASRTERVAPITTVNPAQLAWRRAWPIAVALLIVMGGAAAVFFART